MTFLLILVFLLILPTAEHTHTEKWGKTGHRIVGDIATEYINEETQNEAGIGARIIGYCQHLDG